MYGCDGGNVAPGRVVPHSSRTDCRLAWPLTFTAQPVNTQTITFTFVWENLHLPVKSQHFKSQMPKLLDSRGKIADFAGLHISKLTSQHWCRLCMLSVPDTQWADQALPVDPIRLRWDSDIKAGLDRLQISAENHFRNPWYSEARKQNITIERGALTGLTSGRPEIRSGSQ